MSVSIDSTPPSQTDQYMRAAFEGGTDFLTRMHALSEAKARHDESLAELNLGKTAKAAFDEAQRQRDDAAAKLTEATAALEAAKQTAATTVADADKSAAETLVKAKNDADALIAEAKQLQDDAQQVKSSADAALAAANAERAQLRAEREAANRLAEEAETARATLEAKTGKLHAVLAEIRAAAPGASAAVLAS